MADSLIAILCNRPADGIAFSKRIVDFSRESGIDEGAAYSLRVVFEEIFTNILKYGFRQNDGGRIEVRLIAGKKSVLLVVKDNGIAFDPARPREPDYDRPLAEIMPGRLGLHLVHSLSEDVKYDRSDGWNELRIVINGNNGDGPY